MRKINFFLILLAVLGVSACSENEVPNVEESNEQVKVDFLAQPDVVVTAGTRAAATDFIDPKKFSFYAFKKTADKTYAFSKVIEDTDQAKASYVGQLWSSSGALLPVGTYRFLCLYNVGKAQTLSRIEELSGSWETILNGVVIDHAAATADMDEIFSGEAEGGEVQISGTMGGKLENKIVVKFSPLTRVVSRLDVKFIKLATDGQTEVKYSGTNTIFGAAGTLTSITQTASGVAKKFSLGADTKLGTNWSTDCVFNLPLGDRLTIGGLESGNSTFPKSDEKTMDDATAIAKGIIKGGAYVRGAYILPFMTETKMLSQVLINLAGKNIDGDVNRTINAVPAGQPSMLSVKKNFITLITVKLLSSTSPQDATAGNGKDEENLFNPKVKFSVSIDTKYSGVINSDVEVE